MYDELEPVTTDKVKTMYSEFLGIMILVVNGKRVYTQYFCNN